MLLAQSSRCDRKGGQLNTNNNKDRFKGWKLCKIMTTENTALLSHWPLHSAHKIRQDISNCCVNAGGWLVQGIHLLLKWPALRVQLWVRIWKAISAPSYKVLIRSYSKDFRAPLASLLLYLWAEFSSQQRHSWQLKTNKETTAIELSQLNKEILKISQQKRVSSKVNEIAMHLLAAVFQVAYGYENPNYFLKAKYHNPF